jgi:uncharacterized protein
VSLSLFWTHWPLLLLGSLAVFGGSALQASTGLGLGMVAAPALLLIDPGLVPGPLLVLAFLVSLLIAIRDRRAIDRRGLSFALAGRIPGTVLAGMTISMLPLATYSLVFGSLVLAAVLLSVSGWRVLPTPRNLLTAGFASGYMGTLTSIGAPPLALAYQHDSAASMRATMAAYFVIGSAFSLLVLALFGKFAIEEVVAGTIFVPPLLAGFWISGQLVRRMNDQRARAAVLWLSGLSSLALIVKTLVFQV